MSAPAGHKFCVAVDDRPSSVDALHEALRLRHPADFIHVVNFVEAGATADASSPLCESFSLYLIPRLAKSHWTVEQRALEADETVRSAIVSTVNAEKCSFLVAGMALIHVPVSTR